MRAYKGVSQDGTNRLGQGKIKFKVGKTYREEASKTVARGFHCCENPMECLTYYDLGKDRFFIVEAGGSIDEDDRERIACTELKIISELSIADFAMESMVYIIEHSNREKWQQRHNGVEVAKEKAEADLIAIARGKDPAVKGKLGGFIGLIVENRDGSFRQAALKKVDGKRFKEDTWYKLVDDGVVLEASAMEVLM